MGHWPRLALLAGLLLAALQVPFQLVQVARLDWPVVRLWRDPAAQYRQALGDIPYDLLQAADDVLRADAVVLLVTPGVDVRRWDYTTYHRALYFLAPRPVWWQAPAPSDGTWESRWWIAAPLMPASVRAVAEARGAGCVLVAGAVPLELGVVVAEWSQGRLLQLAPGVPCLAPAARPAAGLDPAWPLQLFTALLLPWLLGGLLLALARTLDLRPHPLEAAALAWILGSGVLTVLLFWGSALGVTLSVLRTLLTVAILAAVLLVGVGLMVRRVHRVHGRDASVTRLPLSDSSRPALPASRVSRDLRRPTGASLQRSSPSRLNSRKITWFALLLLVIQTSVVALLAAGRPLLVWDAWVNWGMKARSLYRADGLSPAFYADASRAVTLMDYPLHVPLLQAWVYRWLGTPDDRLAGAPALLGYASFVGLAVGWLRRAGASAATALAGAALAASLPHVAGLAGMVFPDFTLAVLVGAAGLYLVEWLAGGAAGALAIGALAVGLLPWTKREGVIGALALGAAALLLGRRAPRRVGVALAAGAAGVMVLAGPWWAFTARHGLSNDAFLAAGLGHLLGNLPWLAFVARVLAGEVLGARLLWVWPLAALLVALALRRRERCWLTRPHVVLLIAPPLYVAATAGVYLLSAYVPYQQHVLASAWRLLAHVTALLGLWIALQAVMGDNGGMGKA